MKDRAIKGDTKAGQMLLLLAKQLKLLEVPNIPQGAVFTLKLGAEDPPVDFAPEIGLGRARIGYYLLSAISRAACGGSP